MVQLISNVMGPDYDGPTSSGTYQEGSGIVVGGGYVLTAGHVIYDYNYSSYFNPNSITLADITVSQTLPGGALISNYVADDFNGYRAEYLSDIQADYSFDEANGVPTPANTQVEAQPDMTDKDSVLIVENATVSSGDPGLVVFINPSDMTSAPSLLGSGSTESILGAYTNAVGNVISAANGQATFSVPDQHGDSGGGLLLNYVSKQYVMGTVSSMVLISKVPKYTLTTYFTQEQWSNLTSMLLSAVSGDLTKNQPTNLLVGSNVGDTISGTGRRDILLGEGGDDKIAASSGDTVNGGPGNDLITLTPTSGEPEAMTVNFAVRGGSDVVETMTNSGTYDLNLVGLKPSDISIVAGGEDLNEGAGQTTDYIAFEFVTFQDTALAKKLHSLIRTKPWH